MTFCYPVVTSGPGSCQWQRQSYYKASSGNVIQCKVFRIGKSPMCKKSPECQWLNQIYSLFSLLELLSQWTLQHWGFKLCLFDRSATWLSAWVQQRHSRISIFSINVPPHQLSSGRRRFGIACWENELGLVATSRHYGEAGSYEMRMLHKLISRKLFKFCKYTAVHGKSA